jgi:hypothetical protein
MKKEWWIISVLIVLIIVLLLVIISNKSVFININPSNQSLNNSSNNSVIIDNSDNDYCKRLFNQILAEYVNAQKCSLDSECTISWLDVPCTIRICDSAYNKNYDLTKLKSLSKNYKDGDCDKDCGVTSCPSLTNAIRKCVSNTCTIVYSQTTNEQAPVCGNGICEKDKNESAVPGEYIPGLHDESYYNGYYICGRDCGANA